MQLTMEDFGVWKSSVTLQTNTWRQTPVNKSLAATVPKDGAVVPGLSGPAVAAGATGRQTPAAQDVDEWCKTKKKKITKRTAEGKSQNLVSSFLFASFTASPVFCGGLSGS